MNSFARSINLYVSCLSLLLSCSGYVPTRISNFMIWFLQDYTRDYLVFGSWIFVGENVSKLRHIDLSQAFEHCMYIRLPNVCKVLFFFVLLK